MKVAYLVAALMLPFSACSTDQPASTSTTTKKIEPPPPPPMAGEGIACPMDAKQCADGSYVSRSGPRCEFAACPADKQ